MAKRPPSVTFRPQRRARSGWAKPGRGTAEQRGYGPAWRKLAAAIMVRDKRLCQPCLKLDVVTVASEVDHITPKSAGGTDDPGNLQAICKACHRRKTNREQRKNK